MSIMSLDLLSIFKHCFNSLKKYFCLIVFPVLLITCNNESYQPPLQRISNRIVPKVADGITLKESDTRGTLTLQDDDTRLSLLRITLPPAYVPLRVIDVNLDADQIEEQIIAYKLRGDVATDIIRLLIANFNNDSESYSISWTGETQANNIRSLSITIEDIIGNHVAEIVCLGVNNNGEQTLDIFRRMASTNNRGILYSSILSLTANAGLEIERDERSAMYKNQQEVGQSFPIVRYRQDTAQEDMQIIIKEMYYWNSGVGLYTQGPISTIPTTQLEERQMGILYNGSASDIAQHIEGLWQNSNDTTRLFYLDTKSNSLAIYLDERQEWFVIQTMYKTALGSSPGLWLSTYNMLLPAFQRQIRITLESLDSIRISMEGIEHWDGTYTYLSNTPDLATYLNPKKDSNKLELEGLYTNQHGQELYFSSPTFTMHDGNTEFSGVFHIFFVDRPVLELRVLQSAEFEQDNWRYLIEYAAESEDSRTIKTIRLYPARIDIDSVELIPGEILYFEQVSIES